MSWVRIDRSSGVVRRSIRRATNESDVRQRTRARLHEKPLNRGDVARGALAGTHQAFHSRAASPTLIANERAAGQALCATSRQDSSSSVHRWESRQLSSVTAICRRPWPPSHRNSSPAVRATTEQGEARRFPVSFAQDLNYFRSSRTEVNRLIVSTSLGRYRLWAGIGFPAFVLVLRSRENCVSGDLVEGRKDEGEKMTRL
jgi:hypothetical protein